MSESPAIHVRPRSSQRIKCFRLDTVQPDCDTLHRQLAAFASPLACSYQKVFVKMQALSAKSSVAGQSIAVRARSTPASAARCPLVVRANQEQENVRQHPRLCHTTIKSNVGCLTGASDCPHIFVPVANKCLQSTWRDFGLLYLVCLTIN